MSELERQLLALHPEFDPYAGSIVNEYPEEASVLKEKIYK